MQKKLCPFCDHEIKGKGKCDFCGSWVTKPVIAETSAEFQAETSVNPDPYDRGMDAPKTYQQDDSSLSQSVAANAASAGAVNPNAAAYSSGGAPRRAVLASEAVEQGQTTVKVGGFKTVVRGVVIVIIFNIIIQILLMVLNL